MSSPEARYTLGPLSGEKRDHDKWVEWMRAHGWETGEYVDEEKKRNPFLVSWARMPAAELIRRVERRKRLEAGETR